MNNQNIIDNLNKCWDYNEGFFGKLRQGLFDEVLFKEFLKLLKEISFDGADCIPKNVVSMLWYIPLFMEWQKERISKVIDLIEYSSKKTQIENELEKILGTP